MENELSLKQMQKEWHGSGRTYVLGFSISLILTCLSFFLVHARAFDATLLILLISSFALIQAVVQLIFFLHLGKEGSPWWESVVFFFMITVLLIIVLGTLWIMSDLDARMMTM
jgi:cytochrome o ubiquinol oxidase operon protein cyoD